MRWLPLLVLVSACRSEPAVATPAPVKPMQRRYVAPAPPPVLTAIPEVPAIPEVRFEDDDPRVGALVGTVVDERGEPIEGAIVVVTTESTIGGPVGITEEDGTYIVDDLPPDDYLVTIYYVEAVQEHRVTVGDEAVEVSATLDLTPAPVISITCGVSIENTYVVDGIDTTGLTVE